MPPGDGPQAIGYCQRCYPTNQEGSGSSMAEPQRDQGGEGQQSIKQLCDRCQYPQRAVGSANRPESVRQAEVGSDEEDEHEERSEEHRYCLQLRAPGLVSYARFDTRLLRHRVAEPLLVSCCSVSHPETAPSRAECPERPQAAEVETHLLAVVRSRGIRVPASLS